MTGPADADLWLGGRLRLRQPPRGAHRVGTDAVLLAHLFEPEPDAVVCDLGAATGAIGLAYARLHASCRVVLIEREAMLVDMARQNVASNGLAGRVEVVEADALAPGPQRRQAGLAAGFADIVVTNPPFYEGARHRPSPIAGKAIAHRFDGKGLDGWLRTCADLLRPGGRLGLIHRADGLPDCLEGLRNRFGGIMVRPVQPKAERPAIRVLVSAVKGSRASFGLLPPLVLHEASGLFGAEAEAMHRGVPLAT